MSNSAQSPETTEEGQSATVPRAVVHKKVLDAAEADPDASIEALAETVNGVSADLVEQVLDEYGDPAGDESLDEDEPPTQEGQTATEETSNSQDDTDDSNESDQKTNSADEQGSSSEETEADHNPEIDPDQLTERQRTTLHAISEHPEATQQALADQLGVSSATICHRVNNVDGFEWKNREAFVTQLFETREASEEIQMTSSQPTHDQSDQLAELHQRIDTIEQNLESRSQSVCNDPELVHKIVHACINSDQISEEEELHILRELLASSTD